MWMQFAISKPGVVQWPTSLASDAAFVDFEIQRNDSEACNAQEARSKNHASNLPLPAEEPVYRELQHVSVDIPPH